MGSIICSHGQLGLYVDKEKMKNKKTLEHEIKNKYIKENFDPHFPLNFFQSS